MMVVRPKFCVELSINNAFGSVDMQFGFTEILTMDMFRTRTNIVVYLKLDSKIFVLLTLCQ